MAHPVYNFNAGPACLPKEVMLKAQAEFVDYHGCGYGIIEESHRAPLFEEVIQAAEANIRELMGISDDYAVLFLQGGGSLQFAMTAMNSAAIPRESRHKIRSKRSTKARARQKSSAGG